MKREEVAVTPGQVYWLRITMLDTGVFGTFARYLIAHPRDLVVRIGNARFEISRLLCTPEQDATQTWVAFTSFAELNAPPNPQNPYHIQSPPPTPSTQPHQPR